MGEPAKVVSINDTPAAMVLYDIQESVFSEIETYQKLKIVDSKTERDVRKARQDVRAVRYKIQTRQKELNKGLNDQKREFKAAADALIERLEQTENNLNEKIQLVEAEREKRRQEKARMEKERMDNIESAMDGLRDMATAGLAYGKTSDDIDQCLEQLSQVVITSDVYQEKIEQALRIVQVGIHETRTALRHRLKFEQQWKEQQEEKKRLEEIERKQAAEAEQAATEAAALKAEREAIEKERAKVAMDAKHLDALALNSRVGWCLDYGAWFYDQEHAEAIKMNKEYSRRQKIKVAAAARKEKDRVKAIKPDKRKIQAYIEAINGVKPPTLKTKEGLQVLASIDERLRQLTTDTMAWVDA